MADGDWSDIPREIIALDTLGQVDVDQPDWPYVTIVVPLGGLFDNTEEVDANGYPYITEVYTLTDFSNTEFLADGTYMGEETGYEIIPLEFQALPIPTGIGSSTSIEVIPFGSDDGPAAGPVEFWG